MEKGCGEVYGKIKSKYKCKDKELCFITRNLAYQVMVTNRPKDKEKQILRNMECSSLLSQFVRENFLDKLSSS